MFACRCAFACRCVGVWVCVCVHLGVCVCLFVRVVSLHAFCFVLCFLCLCVPARPPACLPLNLSLLVCLLVHPSVLLCWGPRMPKGTVSSFKANT